jgi:hypothetical protein
MLPACAIVVGVRLMAGSCDTQAGQSLFPGRISSDATTPDNPGYCSHGFDRGGGIDKMCD